MIKFSYNPFSGRFIKCDYNHIDNTPNKKFDEYIRGIIHDDILYLRTYYPFNNWLDIDINRQSKKLLKHNIKDIKKLIVKNYNIKITEVFYNATNDLLKQDLNTISI